MTDYIAADSIDNAAIANNRASILAGIGPADALYGLVLLGAAFLRFTNLSGLPLSPSEAVEALAAWQVLQPGAQSAVIGSPAYFSLTSLLMAFFGVSDVTARLIPAGFGWGLVLLPWLLRGRLRPAGTLTAGLLIAVSPLLSAVSRTAGGDAIALFALLLLVTAVIRYAHQPEDRWVYMAAAALGLGLGSSPLFYSGLLTASPAWWIARRVTAGAAHDIRPSRTAMRNALVLGGLILLLLSTRLLTVPAGLAATARLLGDWLGHFSLSGDLQALIDPALAIGRYETAVFLLGLPAVVWAIWRSKSLGTFFTYWILIAFALILLQRGVLSNALLVILPAYLLIGLFAGRLLPRQLTPWTWAVSGSMILVGGIVLVNVARYLRVAQYGTDLSNLWFAFLALACGAIALYYFWAMTSAGIGQGAFVAVVSLLAIYQWGTAWHLTHVAANDPRERWVQQSTDDDLPLMLETLGEISNQATNADADLLLFSAVDSPVLRWYLRDYWRAQFGTAVPLQAQFQAVITPADMSNPVLGDGYLGGDFGLLRSAATGGGGAAPLQDTLRNWLFHETTQGITEERLILWIRADIMQGAP